MNFTHRVAGEADIPAIAALMARAIGALQGNFLTPAQVEASRAVMGLDTQLIADGTYLLVEADGRLAGCGGWSRRATLYGGDHSTALRDAALLDPARDAARIRAMYTDVYRSGFYAAGCRAAGAVGLRSSGAGSGVRSGGDDGDVGGGAAV